MGRPKNAEIKISVHLRAPPALVEELDRVARERGVSRTVVILDAARAQLRLEQPTSLNIFKKRA